MSCGKCGGIMIYINAFIFSGVVCLIGQVLMDKFKLKPGHVTSLFVVIGAFLDIFNIYDLFVSKFEAGAMVVITSFGHLLIHGALEATKTDGLLGLLTGMFSLTTPGIVSTIVSAFLVSIILKPKN